MNRRSSGIVLGLAAACAFGGLAFVVGVQMAQSPRDVTASACELRAGCDTSTRPAWMGSERARRFASVFKE